MKPTRTAGFWILMMGGLLLLAMLVFGQTMSLIDYELAVSMGLQEPRESVTELGVAVNKGFGAGDTVIYLPMLALGLVGLWKRRPWGVLAMSGALAITAYWPVVSLCLLLFARGTPGFHFARFTAYAVILGTITIYGLWGLCYVYRNHKPLAGE